MITTINLNKLPFLKKWFVTIGHTIYVPKKYWNRCNTISNFKLHNLPLFEHENLHSVRQFDYGKNKWLLKYCLSKKFRWQEEKLTYTLELQLRLKLGIFISRAWYFKTLKKYNMANEKEINEFLNSILGQN